MEKFFLPFGLSILVITMLIFVLWSGIPFGIPFLGIPLPAKKYTYTGPRSSDLSKLSTNSSLPKEQGKLEEVLDSVYIADMITWKTLTEKYYEDYSALPWNSPLEPQLIQMVKEISVLITSGGISDKAFQEMLKRDVYISDDGKNVYWCADLMKDSDRELFEGEKCRSAANCYCEVFERNI